MQISTISILNFSECVHEIDRSLEDRSASVLFLLSVMQKVEELTGEKQATNWGVSSLCCAVAAYPVGRSGCLARIGNFSICCDEKQVGYGASLIVLRELFELTRSERYEQLLIALHDYLCRDECYHEGALTLFKLSLM